MTAYTRFLTSTHPWFFQLSSRVLHVKKNSGLAVIALFLVSVFGSSLTTAQEYRDAISVQPLLKECPDRWVPSSAPGGCSPGFLTLKEAGILSTGACPDGWVASSAPGGCSPGFFTLRLNGQRDSRQSCPDGWVRSSAPGGCSPGYITLEEANLIAIDRCPDGWVRSSAPGGCSPDSFTLEPGFDGIDRAYFNCAFGDACDTMIESIKALGGSCESDGPDTTCELPPLID